MWRPGDLYEISNIPEPSETKFRVDDVVKCTEQPVAGYCKSALVATEVIPDGDFKTMAYIPKDTEWYIAELIMECKVEGDPHNVVHVNIVLIKADSPEDAFEKAEQLGHDSEEIYLNTDDQTVKFIYRGLRDLNAIYDTLEHGAELMFEENIGLPEEKLQDMLTPKNQLAVFRSLTQIESDRPNYASKKITEEVEKRMRGTA